MHPHFLYRCLYTLREILQKYEGERRGEGGREGGNESGRESGSEEREGREGKGGRERAGGTGSNTCFLASTLSLTAKASLACFRNGCLLSGGSNQSRTPFSSTTCKSYSVANILDRNPVRKSTTCQPPDKYRHRERAHPSAECDPTWPACVRAQTVINDSMSLAHFQDLRFWCRVQG